MKKLRAIDVCAGAGGWAEAAKGLPIKVVAAFDREEDCLATYERNHGGVECVQCDVKDYDFGRHDADLVLGGIPCEQISPARNCVKLSAEDLADFHKLVEACLKVPKTVRARWWCYEDVIQIVKHLPPCTTHFLLDSQDFSPQRRKRVYVGNFPQKKPVGNDTRVLASCLLPGPFRVSRHNRTREPRRSEVYSGKFFYPWMPGEKSPTVMGMSSRHDKYSALKTDTGWRQLEWQELAALQGFPTDYVFEGSPTRVQKMVAQAVQIDTARAILEALCAEIQAAL